MSTNAQKETVFSRRLREARTRAALTQMQLGVKAGIDEFSASARVNQYERAVHEADYGTAERLARALGVHPSYLYEADDQLAEVILAYGQLSSRDRKKLVSAAKGLLSESGQSD